MEKFNHYLLTVAYDGTEYCGYQYQENGPSIQGVLEKSFKKVFCEEIRARGASRTDSGVHAHGQRIQIRVKNMRLPFDKMRLILNRSLPADIVIKEIIPIPANFHRISDAVSKTYVYQVWNQEEIDPFSSDFFWHVRQPLNLEAMNKAASYFVGCHDFAALRASGYQTKTSIREMYHLDWSREGNLLKFTVNGNGFLYRMVRNMVGTLVDIGKGKYVPEQVLEILNSKQREFAGPTAPPQGLFLEEIFYPKESFALPKDCNLL